MRANNYNKNDKAAIIEIGAIDTHRIAIVSHKNLVCNLLEFIHFIT